MMTRSNPNGQQRPKRYIVVRMALALAAASLLVVANVRFLDDPGEADTKWYIFFDVFGMVFLASLTRPGRKIIRPVLSFVAALLPWVRTQPGRHGNVAKDAIKKSGYDKPRRKAPNKTS